MNVNKIKGPSKNSKLKKEYSSGSPTNYSRQNWSKKNNKNEILNTIESPFEKKRLEKADNNQSK